MAHSVTISPQDLANLQDKLNKVKASFNRLSPEEVKTLGELETAVLGVVNHTPDQPQLVQPNQPQYPGSPVYTQQQGSVPQTTPLGIPPGHHMDAQGRVVPNQPNTPANVPTTPNAPSGTQHVPAGHHVEASTGRVVPDKA